MGQFAFMLLASNFYFERESVKYSLSFFLYNKLNDVHYLIESEAVILKLYYLIWLISEVGKIVA